MFLGSQPPYVFNASGDSHLLQQPALLPPPFTCKDLSLLWAHLDDPEDSPHTKILGLIISVKSPLPWKVPCASFQRWGRRHLRELSFCQPCPPRSISDVLRPKSLNFTLYCLSSQAFWLAAFQHFPMRVFYNEVEILPQIVLMELVSSYPLVTELSRQFKDTINIHHPMPCKWFNPSPSSAAGVIGIGVWHAVERLLL